MASSQGQVVSLPISGRIAEPRTAGRPSPSVLIADDQCDVRRALRMLLKQSGYRSTPVSSPDAVITALHGNEFDALLLDLNYSRDTTSGVEGLDLLPRVRQMAPDLPVIVMTAFGSIDLAVRAMRLGARDFIEKPWENERLLSILQTQIELARSLRRSRRLQDENQALQQAGVEPIVAESTAMRRVLETVRAIGPSDASVLITGENGAGKSLIARAVHAASPRACAVMITVNAGGLADNLVESELFGHVRGAFTDAHRDRTGRFETADGGTLFLDEISNLPPAVQPKLLRVLETGEYEPVGSSRTRRVDVRVISATNADLHGEVAERRFRQDLMYRLNTIEIHVPPLRERREDVLPLALHCLARHARHYHQDLAGFDDESIAALQQYAWPGNVRELDHVIERAALLARDTRIRAGDLALRPTDEAGARLQEMTLSDAEALLIRSALERCGNNINAAAKQLGVSRSGLYRRLAKHGLANGG